MKNNAGNEAAELQKKIQESGARINDIHKFIGKMYYEQTKDSPAPEYVQHFNALKETEDKMKQLEARIKFLNGIVVCDGCGMDNNVQASFCAGCGKRLPHTFTADGANRCSRCGAVLNPGQKFCGACGEQAEQKEVSEQQAAAEPVKKFCPNCGMKAEEADTLFCPGCGCRLD